jgi:phosphatidylglycerol lysyltransferase
MKSNAADAERARALVLRYGWNSTCFQIVNPGIELWFSSGGDAVVGFVRRGGVRVVAGAPVCPHERLPAVLEEFEQCRQGCVCYFGAEGRVRSLLGNRSDYSAVTLGAQPIWRPEEWVRAFDRDPSLRAQRNRALNKGVRVNEWTAMKAADHPELWRCLREWLSTRGLPPLHFLVEPATLGNLEGRRVFVAERVGRPVGFVVLSPVPERRGWLTEQFVRGHDAPNGTVELALDTAIRAIAADGDEYVTMGIVPLSRRHAGFPPADEMDANPAWLNVLLGWTRAHGRRFYDFDGLDTFKSKFHPDEWEAIYAISKEPRFSPRTLYAIAAAFSQGSPLLAVIRGLGRAVHQELSWQIKLPRRGGIANRRA